MKTTKKDFSLFKHECHKWEKVLGLSSYDIVYKHQDDENKKFDGAYNKGWANYTAEVVLCKNIEFLDGSDVNTGMEIKEAAKHEMIHLLLKRYVINAEARFVNENELKEAEEELVRKLCKIIKDESSRT